MAVVWFGLVFNCTEPALSSLAVNIARILTCQGLSQFVPISCSLLYLCLHQQALKLSSFLLMAVSSEALAVSLFHWLPCLETQSLLVASRGSVSTGSESNGQTDGRDGRFLFPRCCAASASVPTWAPPPTRIRVRGHWGCLKRAP